MIQRYLFENMLGQLGLAKAVVDDIMDRHDMLFHEDDENATPVYQEKDWDAKVSENEDGSSSIEAI